MDFVLTNQARMANCRHTVYIDLIVVAEKESFSLIIPATGVAAVKEDAIFHCRGCWRGGINLFDEGNDVLISTQGTTTERVLRTFVLCHDAG